VTRARIAVGLLTLLLAIAIGVVLARAGVVIGMAPPDPAIEYPVGGLVLCAPDTCVVIPRGAVILVPIPMQLHASRWRTAG
jgi:hypothetical protein